jgi:hypothetical protein
MPAGPIGNHDYPFALMAFGQHAQKYLHTVSITAWQHEAFKLAVRETDSPINVCIFLTGQRGADRPFRLGAPTSPGLRDQPGPRLALKHQPEG